jgi:hypothetical protein
MRTKESNIVEIAQEDRLFHCKSIGYVFLYSKFTTQINMIELEEIPGFRGLYPITHPHQPIKTGFTREKPLSPDKNRLSTGLVWRHDRALKKVGNKH